MSVPSPPAGPRVVRHRLVVVDAFLPPRDVEALLASVLASEATFVPSATHDRRADYRRSLVLDPPAALVHPVVARVTALVPRVMSELRLPAIVPGVVEAQVTASVDGSFFGVHTDAGEHVKKRWLTYVYYFNRAPRGFRGGELRIYDDVIRDGKLARADTSQVVEPLHNRIVFFWAKTMHEVTRVDVPSHAFADARFTVNGWINAA